MSIYFGGCFKKGVLQKSVINYFDCIDLKVEYQTRPGARPGAKKALLSRALKSVVKSILDVASSARRKT
jgi:hypothetical protein